MATPQVTGPLTAGQINFLNSGANYGPPAGAAFPDGPYTVASATTVDLTGGPDAAHATGVLLVLTTDNLSALAGQNITVQIGSLPPITISAANFFSSSAEGFPANISGMASGAVNNVKFDASDSQHAALLIDFGSALVKGADLGAVTITSPIDLRVDVFGENGGTGGHIVDNAANSGGEGITGAPLAASFSGDAFLDANNNGVQDTGDKALAGITVKLLDANGNVVATTTTATDGSYSFTNLAAGTYHALFVAPAGDSFSPMGTNANPALDSIVNAGGATAAVTLTSGQTATNQNAGLFQPASISGDVFTDLNSNGVQNAGDNGLAGVTVRLLDSNGNVVATTTTAADGTYSFTNLVTGTYDVQFVAPTGDVFSPIGTGVNPALNSIVSSAGKTPIINLATGQSVVNQDAGVYAPVSFSGDAFLDANDNGVQDAGEKALAGITVKLLDANGNVIATTTTAANGTYSFTSLAAGTYHAQFIAPTGDVFSPVGTNANGALDSVVSTTGATAPVTLTSGQVSTNQNAGLFQPNSNPAAIKGEVFYDGQCNGIYHLGDAGIQGITVRLLDASGKFTGISTVTDATGAYNFQGLAPGSYKVQFVAHSGMSFTTPVQGSDPSLWSVANPTTGTGPTFTLTAGQMNTTENAGLEFSGSPNGGTLVQLGAGKTYDGNQDKGVTVVGAGNDIVHDGAGNTVVHLDGGGSIVESGPATDIIQVCGGQNNVQGLGVVDFIFAGGGGNVLQGGSGADYIVGGRGNDRIAGGAGPSTLIGGGNTGTVRVQGGAITSYTIGDELLPAGGSTRILFQKGDGVDLLDTFKPGKDSLTVYGYSGPAWVGNVSGHTVMWFGGNDAIVFNDAYSGSTLAGPFPGIGFVASVSTEPDIVLTFDANGNPVIKATDLGTNPTAPAPTPLPPQITGTHAGQTTTDITAIHPFAGVKVSDPNAGLNETLTVQLSNPGNGLLNQLGGGSYNAQSGLYTITGTPGQVTTAIDGLVFVPTAHQVSPGQSVTTRFTVKVTDGVGEATDTSTTVAATAPTTPSSQVTVITGPNYGGALIQGTAGTDSITAYGWNNTINANGGNDTINAGQGGATVNAGPGNVTINLSGQNNVVTGGDGKDPVTGSQGSTTITLGNGNDRVVAGGYGNHITVGNGNDTIDAGAGGATVNAGTGTKTITLHGWSNTATIAGGQTTLDGGDGGAIITLHGGNASLVFHGSNDMLFLANTTATIDDESNGLRISVGVGGGMETITNFGASRGALIDLVGGVGGYSSVQAVMQALASDGHGGAMLSLGSGHGLDFVGITPNFLHAGNFAIN